MTSKVVKGGEGGKDGEDSGATKFIDDDGHHKTIIQIMSDRFKKRFKLEELQFFSNCPLTVKTLTRI